MALSFGVHLLVLMLAIPRHVLPPKFMVAAITHVLGIVPPVLMWAVRVPVGLTWA
jgi:hypothetical protein